MRKITIISLSLVLLLLSLLISSCVTTDNTLSPAEFYEGKTIKMVVNSAPGSLTDLAARTIANRLGSDINGNITVENLREAGGLEGVNYVFRAEPDGLVLGVTSAVKFITNKVLNDPAAIYELEKFSYILKMDSEQTYFLVSPDTPYQSVNALQAGMDMKIAAGTASGYSTLAGMTVIDLLQLDAKVVTGFENNTARALATQRGEVIGYTSNLGAVTAELEAGTLIPLFVIATQRDPLRPDIPAITELVTLSEEDVSLAKLWEKELSAGVIFLTPPKIPAGRLNYLCDLANNWCQDESFRQEIDQVSGHEVTSYMRSENISQSISEMTAALENFQARFAEMVEKYRM